MSKKKNTEETKTVVSIGQKLLTRYVMDGPYEWLCVRSFTFNPGRDQLLTKCQTKSFPSITHFCFSVNICIDAGITRIDNVI